MVAGSSPALSANKISMQQEERNQKTKLVAEFMGFVEKDSTEKPGEKFMAKFDKDHFCEDMFYFEDGRYAESWEYLMEAWFFFLTESRSKNMDIRKFEAGFFMGISKKSIQKCFDTLVKAINAYKEEQHE